MVNSRPEGIWLLSFFQGMVDEFKWKVSWRITDTLAAGFFNDWNPLKLLASSSLKLRSTMCRSVQAVTEAICVDWLGFAPLEHALDG